MLATELSKVKAQRRRFSKKSSGRCAESQRRQRNDRRKAAALQKERREDILLHVDNHDSNILGFAIAFRDADIDGNGEVDIAELSVTLRHLGIEVDPESVSALLHRYDRDGSGALSFPEFVRFAREIMHSQASRSIFIPKNALVKYTDPKRALQVA